MHARHSADAETASVLDLPSAEAACSGRVRARLHPANFLLFIPAALCIAMMPWLEFLWLEAALLILIVIAAVLAGDRLTWSAAPPAFYGRFRKAGRNPLFSFFLPAAASTVLRLSLLQWIPIPHPVVPDEFSHILLAKTFLLGRLANPPHPLWQHFESVHILSQPTTYSSMYMAGQAVFLAAGRLLFGNIFWGVLLSTALFCGALTWFLRAYVPPGWALYGGLLAAVRIGAASYWNNSYWGGSAGALGGAMVLGAYPRLIKTWRPGPAIVFAGGLVLLANTRPYEGAILGVVLVFGLTVEWFRAGKTSARNRVLSGLAAAVIILGVSGWAMTREFQAVTGQPLKLPYQLNQQVYGWPLTLPWIPVRPVMLHHPELGLYRDFEITEHRKITEPAQVPLGLFTKYFTLWHFLFGITLCAVFPFTGRILSARRTRAVWIAVAPVALAVLTEQSGYPHYWSPVVPVIFLFIVEGLRRLAHCRIGSAAVGPAIVRTIVPVFCVMLVVRAATVPPPAGTSVKPNFLSWCCEDVGMKDREPLVQRLNAIPGNHLVIVKYDLKTYDTFEWVYNEPDIDRAKIVFARDMGPEKNTELIRYYPDRRVWSVVVKKDRVASFEPLTAAAPR
jgi:hypothetical protein